MDPIEASIGFSAANEVERSKDSQSSSSSFFSHEAWSQFYETFTG